MEEVTMDISWRTVQLFLDPDGIAEVEVDADKNSRVRCTCVSFSRVARCKHVKFVKEKMSGNDGHYAIQIPVHIDEFEAVQAIKTSEGFRNFVLKYGKIEVID